MTVAPGLGAEFPPGRLFIEGELPGLFPGFPGAPFGLPACWGCLPPPLKLGLEGAPEFPVDEFPGGRLGAVVEPDGLGAVVEPDGFAGVAAGLAGVVAGLAGVATGLVGVAAGLAGVTTGLAVEVAAGLAGVAAAGLEVDDRVGWGFTFLTG